MAYPSYESRGTFAAIASSTTLDIPFPATVNQYDVMFMRVLMFGNRTATTPSGWNLLGSDADTRSIAIFWRRSPDGSETGNVTVTVSASVNITGQIVRYSTCVITGTPYIDLNAGTMAFADSATIPEMETTEAEQLAVALISIAAPEDVANTTDYTEEYQETQAPFGTTFVDETQEIATAGTVDADSASWSGASNHFVHAFALIPVDDGNALISGSVSLSLIATGLIMGRGLIAGAVNLVNTLTGNLKATGLIQGSVNITNTLTGLIKGRGLLRGTLNIILTATGNLTSGVNALISGTVNLVVSLTGNIKGRGKLIGSVTITNVLTGLIKGRGLLRGGVSAVLTLTGNLLAAGSGVLKGGVNLVINATGLIKGRGKLIGGVSLSILATGLIKGRGLLKAALDLLITLTGFLTGQADSIELIEENSLITQLITEDSLITQSVSENSTITQEITENSNI